jgi:hypothetical protein
MVAERQSRIEVVDEGRVSEIPLDAVKRKYMTDPDPKWAKATVVMSSGRIPTPRVRGGCMYLEKVVLRVPSELPENLPAGMQAPNLIHVDIFCVLPDRIISTLETNWEGDPSQGEYARGALMMARSIRSK